MQARASTAAQAQRCAGSGGTSDPLIWQQFMDAIRKRDRFRALACSAWLEPWGPEAQALQHRFDAAARASEAERQRFYDSRQAVGRAALVRLGEGMGAEDLARAMRRLNRGLERPLPEAQLREVLVSAVERWVHAHG